MIHARRERPVRFEARRIKLHPVAPADGAQEQRAIIDAGPSIDRANHHALR
jgi:hypothetical protein